MRVVHELINLVQPLLKRVACSRLVARGQAEGEHDVVIRVSMLGRLGGDPACPDRGRIRASLQQPSRLSL